MVASIPANAIVSVTPGVVGAGGSGLDLSGLFLTTSTRLPVGEVAAFSSAAAVSEYFGPAAAETALASVYFAGFDNSPIKPAAMLFSQYPATAVGAYLRSGNVSGMTLAELQAVNGTFTLTIDGVAVTTGTINLSAATSFSAAAVTIEAGLAHYDAVVTASISGTTLTCTAVASGTLAVGQVIEGSGITAGTKISALGTGTGGTGTYTVDTSQTAASTTVSAGKAEVTYDSVSGAFVITGGTPATGQAISFATGTISAALKLTAATGAVQSGGADTATPAGAMADVIASTQDFATFATVFKPSTDDMIAFSDWANTTGNRFLYVMWDNDATVTTNANTASAGYAIKAAGNSGTCMVYDPANGVSLAAFIMGAIASIDFERAEGRTNGAFRSQAGLTAGVTNATIADRLITNGYNFYGAYATANDRFVFLYDGSVTGDFLWLDTFVNQIWMNNAFQLALLDLLVASPSIPYNAEGYALIEAALSGPINAAVNFGAIRAGVPLSPSQIANVNTAAGRAIDATLTERGWYLLVAPASAPVRAARGSPPITFWYMDGQSIQKIALNSLEVQ